VYIAAGGARSSRACNAHLLRCGWRGGGGGGGAPADDETRTCGDGRIVRRLHSVAARQSRAELSRAAGGMRPSPGDEGRESDGSTAAVVARRGGQARFSLCRYTD